MRISQGEKRNKQIPEVIITENFSNVRYQTTDPGSSKNTKQDKCHK